MIVSLKQKLNSKGDDWRMWFFETYPGQIFDELTKIHLDSGLECVEWFGVEGIETKQKNKAILKEKIQEAVLNHCREEAKLDEPLIEYMPGCLRIDLGYNSFMISDFTHQLEAKPCNISQIVKKKLKAGKLKKS